MSPEEFVWWIKGLLELNELNESVKSLVEENIDVVIGEIRKSKEKPAFTTFTSSGSFSAYSTPQYSGAIIPPAFTLSTT
jgi:hypothetical protein